MLFVSAPPLRAAYPARLSVRPVARPPSLLAVVGAVVAPLVVVYAALYLSAAVARPLSDLGGAGYNALRLIVSVALCLAPLAVWPFRARSYALTAGLTLAALALVNLVHAIEYSELVTIGAIDATLATTGREAREFFRGRGATLALVALGATLSLTAVVAFAGRVPRGLQIPGRVRLTAGALGLAGLAVLVAFPMRLFPISTLKNAVDYLDHQARYQDALAARAGHSFGASSAVAWDEPPVVVLVLGESTRRGALGLYGYHRPTTPELSGLDGLVTFEDAVAAASVTQPSVSMMLSAATPATLADHPEGSWLALAREVGFETVWISNQDRTDGTATALLADDADRVVYTSHSWSASGQLDGDVLPVLDRVLADRTGPLAVVVHLMGAHDDYALRYPDRFARFGHGSYPPARNAALASTERAMIDHYDNAVAYTDWVVAEVFRRAEATGAPAAGVFVSDHGENLYDTPARLRGHGVPGTTAYEIEVPLALWSTPSFRAARPDLVDAAERNRALPVSTADLFWGLADLVGADWSGARAERNPFSPQFQPAPRRVLLPTGDVVDARSLTGEGTSRPDNYARISTSPYVTIPWVPSRSTSR